MSDDAAAKVAARLSELWLASRPTILDRTNSLHSTCDSLSRNPADSEARVIGLEAAHKLSGVLGIFGLPQGSEIASSIESMFRSGEPLTAEKLAELRDRIASLDEAIASKDR